MAQIATIQPDATAGIDAVANEAAPTTNNGTSSLFALGGKTSADPSYAHLKLDLSGIPAAAVCTSAVFTLWIGGTGTATRVYEVWKLDPSNTGWTELGMTWNTRDGTNAWTGGALGGGVEGTDVGAADIGQGTYTANDPVGTAVTFTLTNAAIQAAFGGTLYLVVKRQGTTTSTSPTFRSSDSATSAERPKIVIAYTTTLTRTPAATAALSTAGVARTVAATAAISRAGITRTASATAALTSTLTRSAATSAALSLVVARTAATSAAISQASITRTVAATAAVGGVLGRDVTASAALSASVTRTAATSAALSATLTRTATASASTALTNTRTAATSAAIGVQTTSTFQPDGTAGRDTYVDKTSPTANFATAQEFSIFGMGSANPSYALISFDLSGITAGATASAASLALTVSTISGLDRTFDVYQLIANTDWTEAAANWNTKNGSTAWAGGANGGGVAGTDIATTAIGTATYGASTPTGTVLTFTLSPAAVQAAFGGVLNLLIKKQGTSTSSTPRMATSDNTTAAWRPLLSVTYTVLTRDVPASAALSSIGKQRTASATAAIGTSSTRTVTATAATSRVYYLSTTGSDAANGLTTGTAWRTWTFALPQLGAGDTLIVAGGDYVESPQLGAGSTTAGTLERPTIILAATGEEPWIRGAFKINDSHYWTFDGINFDGSTVGYTGLIDSVVYLRHANNWTLKNCEIRSAAGTNTVAPGSFGGFKGLVDIDGDNWIIEDCYIHHNPGLKNSSPNDVDGNGIHQDHLLYVSHGTGGIVRRTLLTDAPNGRAVKFGTGGSGIDPTNLTIDQVTALRCNGPTAIMGSLAAANGVIDESLVGGPVGSDATGTGMVTSTNATSPLMFTITNSHGWSNGSPSGKGTTWVSSGQTYIVEGAGNTYGTDPLLDAHYEPHLDSLWTGAIYGVGTITRGHLTGLSSYTLWPGPASVTSNERDVTATVAVSRAGNTRSVATTGAISSTGLTRTTTTSAAISATTTRTAATTAALSVAATGRTVVTTAALSTSQNPRAVTTSAALSVASLARSVATTAAISQASITRTATTSATFSVTTVGATRTVPTTASVSQALNTRTAATNAAVSTLGLSRTVSASASILSILTRTVSASASLSVTGTFIRDVDASAALSSSATQRTVTATLAVSRTLTRDVAASASFYRQRDVAASAALSLASVARIVTTSAAISQAVTTSRTAATSAALSLAGLTRTVPASSALATLALTRTVTTSAAFSTTTTRTVATTAAISQTETRAVAASVALSTVNMRAVSASAAIGGTRPLVIELTGRDDSVIDVAGSDDSIIDVAGSETMPVISGATFYLGSDHIVRVTLDGTGTIAGSTYRAKLWDKRKRSGYLLSTVDGVSSISILDAETRILGWEIADTDWPLGVRTGVDYEYAVWSDDDGSDIPLVTGPATLVRLPGSVA